MHAKTFIITLSIKKVSKYTVATSNLKDTSKQNFHSFLLVIFSNFRTFSYTINVIDAAGTFFRRFGVMPL